MCLTRCSDVDIQTGEGGVEEMERKLRSKEKIEL